jgi:hypothetical protein
MAPGRQAALKVPPPARFPDAVGRYCAFIAHASARLQAAGIAVATPYVSAVVSTLLAYLAGEQIVHAPALAASGALRLMGPLMTDGVALTQSLAAIVPALSVSHQASWRLVLGALADIASTSPLLRETAPAVWAAAPPAPGVPPGGRLGAVLAKVLSACDALHGAAPQDALDAAVGAVLGAVGPRFVLNVLPLHLFGEAAVPRVWTLPLYRKYVGRGELAAFGELVLPAAQVRGLVARCMWCGCRRARSVWAAWQWRRWAPAARRMSRS